MKPGPKSILDNKLIAKIRTLYLEGNSFKDIQEILDINSSTWDTWNYDNYKDFRTQINNIKKERIIKKAEAELEVLMSSEDERVKTSNIQFALETLAKSEGYSKRTELTGKDGEDLTFNVMNYGDKDSV